LFPTPRTENRKDPCVCRQGTRPIVVRCRLGDAIDSG